MSAPPEARTTAIRFAAVDRRHNPWVIALAATPLALIPVLLTAAALTQPAFGVFAIHLFIIGSIALAYALLRRPWPKLMPVDVEVTRDGLLIDRERIERADIQRGDLVHGGASVSLERRSRGRRELDLHTEREARALLRGFDMPFRG